MVKKMVVFVFLLGGVFEVFFSQDARFGLGVGGVLLLDNVGYGVDSSFKVATLGPYNVLGFGGEIMCFFDEVWGGKASFLYFPAPIMLWQGDVVISWYGNGTAPLGPAIHFGVWLRQFERFFGVYPAIGASYTWGFGCFYFQPEVMAYWTYYDLNLGLKAGVISGFLF